MLELGKMQFRLLSNFFCDVAKGLFLAAVVNPAVPFEGTLLAKLLNSCLIMIVATALLYSGLYFSKLKERL